MGLFEKTYHKMWQTEKVSRISKQLLPYVTESCYKVWHVFESETIYYKAWPVLQSVTCIWKRDNLLQSVNGVTKYDERLLKRVSYITKCDDYSEVTRNNLNIELSTHFIWSPYNCLIINAANLISLSFKKRPEE